jgi:hypothetical protein
LLPPKGLSLLDVEQPLVAEPTRRCSRHPPNLRPGIPLVEMDAHINGLPFAPGGGTLVELWLQNHHKNRNFR